MEILQIEKINFELPQLILSRNKAERTLKELTEYFEDFERTQFKGRYITNEYYEKQKDLKLITEYFELINKQIEEKRSKKLRSEKIIEIITNKI